jgi:hypothetical protein
MRNECEIKLKEGKIIKGNKSPEILQKIECTSYTPVSQRLQKLFRCKWRG